MDVSDALGLVPRADFLPRRLRRRAGYDGPLAIGHGSTCSQPRTVADMLRLLDVRPGHRVLDLGSGSGWTTALLAELTGPAGRVTGVELVPELVDTGRRNLARRPLAWASIRRAEAGVLGWPPGSPYDRILVSAAATELPGALVAQLAADGRMVIPVTGRLLLVAEPGPVVTEHGSYRFVPLR